MKIITEHTYISTIPILTVTQEDMTNSPVVIFIHGFGGNKEQAIEFGYHLAKAGIFFIAFDAEHHGERSTGKIEDIFSGEGLSYPQETGLDPWFMMHECIVKTEEDINAIVDGLKDDVRVDIEKLGVTGFSMGACATYYLASRVSQIKAAVPIAGVGLFTQRFDDVLDELNTYETFVDSMKGLRVQTEKWRNYFQINDPFPRIRNYSPKPIFIMCGQKDVDQPKIYSVKLYQDLKPLYINSPERLMLKLYDVAHELTLEMMMDACDWFSKHLF